MRVIADNALIAAFLADAPRCWMEERIRQPSSETPAVRVAKLRYTQMEALKASGTLLHPWISHLDKTNKDSITKQRNGRSDVTLSLIS
jgi:hypothetical protein